MKKMKNGYHLVEDYSTAKFPITDTPPPPPTPQSLGLYFSECQSKWKIDISHYEKLAPISQKTIIQQNFQLPNPPKFGSLLFQMYMEMASAIYEKIAATLWKLVSQKISNQERFLILVINVETEPRFSVYPTSHICVILNFLIFPTLLHFSTHLILHPHLHTESKWWLPLAQFQAFNINHSKVVLSHPSYREYLHSANPQIS